MLGWGMAPALPVFAAEAAPTGIVLGSGMRCTCGSGLVSRKGCRAAPGIYAALLRTWGRFAARSRHKAAPTRVKVSAFRCCVAG
ncbi:hypothetical protein C1X73_23415 [Pseudomonas sp. FW305-130]|nr:hypothetical protein C1X73_23415 [Pseudomonas sp. FW305-130]